MLDWVIALLLFGCAIEALFIYMEFLKMMRIALVLKTAASVLFVLAGILAAVIAPNGQYAHLIVLGLALGAVGDICLNLRFLLTEKSKLVFLIGIAAFLLGHVAYLAALILFHPGALVYALPAATLLAYFIIRFVLSRVNVGGVLKTFGIIYLCVVLFMAVYAVSLFALSPQSVPLLLFAAGGSLFAASDILLVLNQFGKRAYPAFRTLNLSLYYLGQVCIALTIALMPNV